MKYSSEHEMCTAVTQLLVGIMIDSGSDRYQTIPEVPRSSHNNHSDMLIIDRRNARMLMVEYKLNNYKKLSEQLTNGTGIHTIGIVNQRMDINKLAECLWNVYGYNGEDYELEILATRIRSQYNWTEVGNGMSMLYWWGYADTPSSLDGGLKTAPRVSLFQLYMNAVVNIQAHYNQTLKFREIYALFGAGSVYSKGTALKHYNNAMKVFES